MNLKEWEDRWRNEIASIPDETLSSAGSLLDAVPDQDEWEVFQQALKESWWSFERCLNLYPHTLLMLYAGLAFHEYEDNTFWPQFWHFVGVNSSQAKQNEFNDYFRKAARSVELPIQGDISRHFFVGSAVYFIGVPVSLWDGFLEICEWALWHTGWESLSDEDWAEAVGRRCGSRTRLIKFLTLNRKSASEFVREMLDARELLRKDKQMTLSEIEEISILRPEYYEEVAETAEFLRPDNPDSLLEDRPRLIWRDDRIAVHLPLVSEEGDYWRFGEEQKPACDVATEFPINGKAFKDRLLIELYSDCTQKSFRIAGLHPFGLFDEQRSRFANTSRTRLPANSYRLISRTRLEISENGWDVIEKNEHVQLEDGTDLFVTSLFPIKDRPTLSINGGQKIEFGRQQKINVRVFSGLEDTHVLRFGLNDDSKLIIEKMPTLVLAVPVGFLPDENDESHLNHEFSVSVNGHQVSGKWKFYEDYPKDPKKPEWEYFYWKWGEDFPLDDYEILVESIKLGVLRFGTKRSQHVSIVSATNDAVWTKLHEDKCWIWVLLSQIQDDATWENFWIARQAMAGFQDLKINQNDWRKLKEHGFIKLRGKFEIQRSCLAIQPDQGSTFVAHYAGLVNRLYALVREVSPEKQIDAKQNIGFPPHFEIHWPSNQRQTILSICHREGIEVKEHSLWNH